MIENFTKTAADNVSAAVFYVMAINKRQVPKQQIAVSFTLIM